MQVLPVPTKPRLVILAQPVPAAVRVDTQLLLEPLRMPSAQAAVWVHIPPLLEHQFARSVFRVRTPLAQVLLNPANVSIVSRVHSRLFLGPLIHPCARTVPRAHIPLSQDQHHVRNVSQVHTPPHMQPMQPISVSTVLPAHILVCLEQPTSAFVLAVLLERIQQQKE